MINLLVKSVREKLFNLPLIARGILRISFQVKPPPAVHQ